MDVVEMAHAGRSRCLLVCWSSARGCHAASGGWGAGTRQARADLAQGGAPPLKKSHTVLFRTTAEIFAFIDQERNRFSVKALCRRYRVTRAAFYAWKRRGPSAHDRRDAFLLTRIRSIFEASAGTYGSPRIHAELKDAGEKVSEKRVARLMKENRLAARAAHIYRRAQGVRKFFAQIPNLLLGRVATAPDQVWVGDITYLRSGGRWRYLAVVMDLYSRRILGWRYGPQRDLRLTLGALNRAIARRHPKPGLIFHSDRGIEYTQFAYQARLVAAGIHQSTKRPTGFGDNASMESFFHSMKADIIRGYRFANDAALLATLRPYMRRYNRDRRHSSLGYRSPIDYERLVA